MTQKELESKGYTQVHTALTQGYVSRKSTPETRKAEEYQGDRIDADYYVLMPNKVSTRYCWKVYYGKKEDVD